MDESDNASTPPFGWSDREIAFVAVEIGRQYTAPTPERIADIIESAARRVAPHEGRARLLSVARQILQAPPA